MIRVTRITLLLLLMLAFVQSVQAAIPTTAPVTATIEPSTLEPGDEVVVQVTVDVPEGLHAQSHTPSETNYIAFKLTLEPNAAIEFKEPQYPTGEDHTYPQLGKLNVYTGKVVTKVPGRVKADAPSGPVKINGQVVLQMCDDRQCFMPQRPKFSIDASITGASTTQPGAAQFTEPAPRPKTQWTTLTAFGAALLAGLLFNIMPCVLPVLPLKAVGFYEASQHNRARSFMLGLVFSLGLITVFALLALVVLVLGLFTWGELFTKGWFIWSIVVLLVVLALGLLGTWNVSLPVGVYRFEPRHDTVGGNYFWGFLTAILATPCTAPLLPGVLAWAALQPRFIGVPAVLLVGVGMAIPYLILSAAPELARKFPRSGPWTELFKQMMGFLLLASAAYFAAGRLIHGPNFWWVVAGVIIAAGVFLIVRTAQLSPRPRPIAIACVIAAMLIGVSLWWTQRITYVSTGWTQYSDVEFKNLRDTGKPVLVKFTANWCGTCQVIEGSVFRDEKVWNEFKRRGITPMKVDFSDDSDAPGKDLLLSLNPTGGIPLTAIYGPGAKEPVVLDSLYSTAELLKALDQATHDSVAAR